MFFFWCLLIIFLLILSERKGKTFEVYNEHISEENYDRKIWVARDPHHFKRNANRLRIKLDRLVEDQFIVFGRHRLN